MKTRIIAAIVMIGGTLMQAAEATPKRLLVSIPDKKLAVIENDQVLRMYEVAVGKPATPSPTGEFQVVSRIPNPTWYTPGKIVPPGPGNPLGTRWIGLSQKGYGIHGTNVPRSIGKAASHGCIRMRKADVEELFALVNVGDAVEILAELNEASAKVFHPAAAPVMVADGGLD